MYLPHHLSRHESLSKEESDYLYGLTFASRHSHDLYASLAEAVINYHTEGYHAEYTGPHWKSAALKIYPTVAKEGEGLSAQAVADGAAYLRDCQRPTDALRLLMRVDTLHREWRLERAKSMVTTADKLSQPIHTKRLAA